jgi:uncharacterized protein YceK
MNVKLFFINLVATILLCNSSFSQTYNMSNTSFSTCGGNFYDSGGSGGNYGNSENLLMTFTSNNGNRIQLNFSSFVTESADWLYVYDGTTTNAPLIGTYSGTQSSFSVQSTGTSLTFKFISDGSVLYSGWSASISCTTPALTSYPFTDSQTISGCGGVFYDDGGAESNYSNNQNSTMTFCPSTGSDYLVFSFPYQFSIASGDTLFVYSGTTTSSTPIGVYTGSNGGATISSPLAGACVTFKFVSNSSTNSSGWQAIISCSSTPPSFTMNMTKGTISTCGGTFYDSGGSTKNYGNNETKTVTFTSDNGNRIQFNFSAFVTESADWLYVYDGTTTNAPLIGTYSGTQSSFSVQSTGTSLTFQFISDGSVLYSGWSAGISCTTPVLTSYPFTDSQTISGCGGVFYDDGGADGNYSNIQNSTMTFCPSTISDYLIFSFPYQFSIASGDTLFVYSGTTTSSSPIGVYTGSNSGATITSPLAGACVTFKFVSNSSTNSSGWQALISCSSTPPSFTMNMFKGTIPTCGGTFYDSGGAASSYGNNETKTVTFTSDNGNRIQFNFSSFVTESADWLYVYDGTTTNAPLIGTYSGTQSSFSVQSTGTSLTFKFISDGSVLYSGWSAGISCTTPVLTSYPFTDSQTISGCGGVFYDDGGADGNYSNIQNSTMTFCPSTGSDYLVFSFPYQFSIASGDTLFVYSGTTTSSTPIGIYTGSNSGATISSPLAGACVTFKFVSNSSTNSSGWQALISCSSTPPSFTMNMIKGTIPTCGGTFYDSGGAARSYGNNETKTVTFISTSGCTIRFDFSSFVTESADLLYVYDGTTTNAPLIGTYSGSQSSLSVQSTGTALTFKFISDGSVLYSGWSAVASCPTTTNATITPTGISNICTGDSIVLTANAAISYLWNTGSTTQSITVDSTDNYYVTIVNNIGCTATSNPVTVNVNSLPSIPIITQNTNVLSSSLGHNYQWFLDNIIINGATSQDYTVLQSGDYTVIVTDSNGCSAVSLPFNLASVGLTESAATNNYIIIPNPNNGKFRIATAIMESGVVKITNILGKIVYQSQMTNLDIDLSSQPKGTYIMSIHMNDKIVNKKIVIE